jgi:hypothetical protein
LLSSIFSIAAKSVTSCSSITIVVVGGGLVVGIRVGNGRMKI